MYFRHMELQFFDLTNFHQLVNKLSYNIKLTLEIEANVTRPFLEFFQSFIKRDLVNCSDNQL